MSFARKYSGCIPKFADRKIRNGWPGLHLQFRDISVTFKYDERLMHSRNHSKSISQTEDNCATYKDLIIVLSRIAVTLLVASALITCSIPKREQQFLSRQIIHIFSSTLIIAFTLCKCVLICVCVHFVCD